MERKIGDIKDKKLKDELTSLAIAAIAGIVLNAILPGNDYAFGKDPEGDASRGVDLRPHELEQELKNQK